MPESTDGTAAISLREVDKEVWKKFRALAMLSNMTLQDYLRYLVEKEMKNVQVNQGSSDTE